jgi:hypothetical protein
MTRQLVLVHGRSQQGKDPAQLKREWLDVLDEGLAKNGLTLPIAEDDVRFPFYGDTLLDLVDGRSPEQAADVIIKGDSDDKELELFLKQVMDEVRQQTGVTEQEIAEVGGAEVVAKGPLDWEWVRTAMKVIDRRTQHGSALSIFLATHDVYYYLVDKIAKEDIDEGVSAALTPGVETVVVGHSLGTVVTHNLLRERGEEAGWVVPQYVTLGSPLAVTRIRKVIVPPRWPACASRWFNARDERDVVALYPLTPDHFAVGDQAPGIVNKSDVRNDTPNRHGISGYLSDADVARVIHDALVTD